nr:SNF2 helicase-associated domain-containing protein [uncultured Dethiosulfovibrio sp.]
MRMLAELKTPLVRFRGQWIETSPEHIKKALDFLKKQGSRKVTASEILASARANYAVWSIFWRDFRKIRNTASSSPNIGRWRRFSRGLGYRCFPPQRWT